MRSQTGYLTQTFSLYPDLTVAENIRYSGDLRRIPPRDIEQRGNQYLRMFDMHRFTDRLAGKLSGGMRQKLSLVCALVPQPRVLLLDEPTTGVDPQSRERIFVMLAELRRQGTALLHTTHQLGEAEGVCDRVVIIDHGHVVAEGTPAALIERTLGRAHEVVITLDRVADRLPDGMHADGRVVRAGVGDLASDLPALLEQLRAAGYGVADVRVDRADLHAVFLHLTGRELRE